MQLRTSTSMQMIDHKVENLVSAINKPKIQWKNKGKVERMRCSRRQEEKHGKSAKRKFRKLFANQFRNAKISQTVRKPVSHCEIQNPQYTVALRKLPFAKFRIAKIRNESQTKFAMRISQKPISQCQMQFRNAKIFAIPHSQCENFAMRKFAMRKFRNVNFAMPISFSHCEIHCLCEIHICRPCHPL